MKIVGSLFNPGAADASIDAVRAVLPATTPEDYFEFLRRSDGGEVGYDSEGAEGFDCLQIYSSTQVQSFRAVHLELWPSMVIIGSDGGTQHLGYDISAAEPWPLVMLLPGCGQTFVATSMTDLEERFFRAAFAATPTSHV